ncbi:hypothetical protein TWF694_007529 [Orbilia ellipsospora]|uniref:Uncharacterized protein n=1 Tax=Orbilia ellipsospora TaxID=2528407 RepID=A0AAV9XKL1_9PEZI
MSDSTSTSTQVASSSTPSRPANRNKQKTSPQGPNSGKKGGYPNNRGNRRSTGPSNSNGYNNGQNQKRESALTKKFREAAQADSGANSDSAINSIIDKGMVTPPATPGPSGRREPNAYVSDSAIAVHTDGNKKKNFNKNNKKGKGKRANDLPPIGAQSITPPQEPAYTPPNDFLFGKTPNKLAYAGACFHDASPAPNALPLPKFFSKSVPTTSDKPSLSKMLAEAEAEPNNFDLKSVTGARSSSPPPMPPKTPLDIFFKADKEEKARKALQSISINDIFSPKPSSTPANEPRVVRQITPPSAALQASLGSPFGGKTPLKDDSENDRDMLFSMDFSDSKKSTPRPVEEVVTGPRHRPLSASAYDPETLVKRQEKAKELKAALMMQQLGVQKTLELMDPPSPSPKPKAKVIDVPDTVEGGLASPTLHERRVRTNNVGFAPAPRIRHFNQNRPVNSRANGHHRGGRNQGFSSQPQNNFNPIQAQGQQPPQFDPVRARMGEAHIRGVLKLDSPIPAI